MAIAHPAIVFPDLSIHRHSSLLSKHTTLPPTNDQPYEQLQQRVQQNEPRRSQSYLTVPLLLELHLLKLFSRHQRRHFPVSTVLPRPKHGVVAHLFFRRRGAKHAAHSRKPIQSTDSAVAFVGVRRGVLQQIVCLALLACSDKSLHVEIQRSKCRNETSGSGRFGPQVKVSAIRDVTSVGGNRIRRGRLTLFPEASWLICLDQGNLRPHNHADQLPLRSQKVRCCYRNDSPSFPSRLAVNSNRMFYGSVVLVRCLKRERKCCIFELQLRHWALGSSVGDGVSGREPVQPFRGDVQLTVPPD
jgi:hypothetical protein